VSIAYQQKRTHVDGQGKGVAADYANYADSILLGRQDGAGGRFNLRSMVYLGQEFVR
jgi:hypothetical protein